ncbi:fimbrial protein [Pseudomonas sp. MRSN 12121]|uniref:fimbrial protein n=1 Tax=Pseudomonas sp. MRSN 12121 TaxID=1611770 RepID=UPI0009E63FBE|nr:fimbrial protein [Pseudomonas sp. MRSN 12121]
MNCARRVLAGFNFYIMMLAIAGWSSSGWAFTCQALGKTISGSGTLSVYVNLQPAISPGQNLVVDLSQSIQCKNDRPSVYRDPIRVGSGSAYEGVLASFSGTLSYHGVNQPFPLRSPTSWVDTPWGTFQGWRTVLYLTPVSSASGVVIQTGQLFASLALQKQGPGGSVSQTIIWNLYANNSVVVPTGGCDVSARNVTVTLPDYPGSAAVPVTVHCAKSQKLAYYLSGTTTDAANTIFTNSASASAAQGVGVQIFRNGGVLAVNNTVSLGSVDTSPVNLGLSASYARTSGQVTAGNVQSIIGVTFLYE